MPGTMVLSNTKNTAELKGVTIEGPLCVMPVLHGDTLVILDVRLHAGHVLFL